MAAVTGSTAVIITVWEDPMGKARILVVEDDFDISNMLQIYFKGQGYDVEVASRGSQAFEKTRQDLPHLIN